MCGYKYVANYFGNDNKFIDLHSCLSECKTAAMEIRNNIVIRTIDGVDIYTIEYDYMLPSALYKVRYL